MKQVPTLTLDGYVADVDLMINKLFEYFLLSEYSQTKLFYTEISSLPYLIRDAGPDMEKLEVSVRDTLVTMYGRYWKEVEVITSVQTTNKTVDKTNYRVNIDIKITVDGIVHTLSKSALVDKGDITNIDKKIEYFLGADNV